MNTIFVDINECDTIECPLGTDCVNSVGSFSCERPTIPPPIVTTPTTTTAPYVFNATVDCDMSTYDPTANGLCMVCHSDRIYGVINDEKLNHKAVRERNFRDLPMETQNERIKEMLLIDGMKSDECVNNWTFNNNTKIRGREKIMLIITKGL